MSTGNRKLLALLAIIVSFFFYVPETNGQPPAGFDPDDPPETTIQIAPYLTFGGQIELEYMLERNFDLDGKRDEGISLIEPGLTIAFSFDPSKHIQAFTAIKLAGEFLFEDDDKTDHNAVIEIEQAYLFLKDLFWKERFSFQFGRQRFEDEREWLYDEELDGVRAFYRISDFSFELSASRLNLADRDPLNPEEEERINNYIAHAKYEREVDEIETILGTYLFVRDDQSNENESPVFLGIHASGDITETLGYWLELAGVLGEEAGDKIRGFGFDIGSTYEFDFPIEPSVTLAYAFGTGDGDPDNNVDTNFRQTGLHNNESSFNGVPDFKYYGEVLDPELSNLHIFTAGVGVNFTEESSLDLVYHYYLQHKTSDELRDVAIDAEPDGESKKIGSAIDLVMGYELENKFELALILGYFIPGKAFLSESANAFSTRLEVQYEF